MADLLKLEGVKKTFDGFVAVDEVSFSIGEESITAVIGPNGAGKTTLFNLITGHLKCDSGSIVFKGKNITNLPPHTICEMGISRAFQVPNIFQRLTTFENVQISVLSREGRGFSLFKDAQKQCVDETLSILEETWLMDKKDVISSNLSHGDQKLLEIAMALGSNPKLLLLDEPTAGMSPEETRKTVNLIKTISERRGIKVLFTEHDMDIVFGISERIVVMSQGKVIADGTPEEIRKNPEVKRAYLGE